MHHFHALAVLPDSPIRDRKELAIEGRTAADDLADLGAGQGSTAVEDDTPDTLIDDLKGFDLTEGYHDELPDDHESEEDGPQHDYEKRHADTRTALNQERAEKAALKARLEELEKQRTQPNQPNVLRHDQVDAIAAIDAKYEADKAQTTQYYMDQIKLAGQNANDPNRQQKVASLWAKHQEQLVELDGNRREAKAYHQSQRMTSEQQHHDREAARALQAQGLDPVKHKDLFLDQVAILNFRQPGWESGMDANATYDFVAKRVKESTPMTQGQETPYQQHQALRQGAMGALKAGVRHDQQKSKAKIPEEKDISFADQIRADRKKRTVTHEAVKRFR